MPRDGTVFQLTSNVILFLEQLLDFVETVASILQQDSSYNQVRFACKFWSLFCSYEFHEHFELVSRFQMYSSPENLGFQLLLATTWRQNMKIQI